MSILKKSSTFTFVVALIMVMAMSVTAFGAEVPVDQESANAVVSEESNTLFAAEQEAVTVASDEDSPAFTTVTNARFLKSNGKKYKFGMGTKVIQSASWQDENTIKLYLKPATILFCTGTVTSVKYTTGGPEQLQSDAQGNYILLNKADVTYFANNTLKGIKIAEMHFTFTPFNPPMPNPVLNAYFTCDEFQSIPLSDPLAV